MKTASLSLTHIYRPADTSIKNPAVLFMFHGYGSNKEDLFSFASELPSKFCIISVEAPNELQPYGYAWYAIHFDAIDGKWSDDNQAIASRILLLISLQKPVMNINLIQLMLPYLDLAKEVY